MPVRVVVRGAGLREIRHPPRSFAEQVFNIQRWTEMARGGHFAARQLEAPDRRGRGSIRSPANTRPRTLI
jgi:hypothetical protein